MKIRNCRRCGWTTLDGPTFRARPDERGEHRRYSGRGLCTTCYEAERRNGDLDRWPRVNWRTDDLLDEWALLRSDGVVDIIEAAQRIGVSPHALDRALHRATAAGDDRGRHIGCRRLDHLRTRSDLTTMAAGV